MRKIDGKVGFWSGDQKEAGGILVWRPKVAQRSGSNKIQFMKTKFRFLTMILIGLASIHSSVQAQLVINEILSSNTIVNLDEEDYYEYNDWIEIYNQSSNEIDISGFHLTDDLDQPSKWTFPQGTIIAANDYLIVWADGKDKVPGDQDSLIFTNVLVFEIEGHHSNFKLSSTGEEIALFNSNGVELDKISFGNQLGNVSFGRSSSDPSQWVYFSVPSPKAVNNTIETNNLAQIDAVLHNPMGGIYSNSTSVTLNSNEPEAIVRYTLDGSIPNENSLEYSAPINISSSTVVRSRAFLNGRLASSINTQSYLIDNSINLASISISTKDPDLWNLSYGIYQNSYKNREIPASIEMFDNNGTKLFGANAGIEIFGSNIFNAQQKPFDISFKGKYGNDVLSHPIFKERGEISYKNFVLRNGGNDNGLSFFRDALVMSMVKESAMNLDYQAFEPVTVYLNGSYWGIYNLREKLNEQYVSYLHDVDPNSIDILEDNAEQNHGSRDAYLALTAFIENNDLSINENFDYVASQIDMDSYLDYKILKIFIGYWVDLVNLKYWKKANGPDEKWRYIAFDLEHSFAELTGDSCQVNTLQKVISADGELPEWSTLFFRKLLENPAFKNEFIQRFLGYLETSFNSENILGIIDHLEDLYMDEMPDHISKWSFDAYAIPSYAAWQNNVEDLRTFAECRPAQVYQHLLDFANESETVNISVEVPDSEMGNIFINDVKLEEGFFSGTYIKNQEIRIAAQPNIGHEFLDWNENFTNDTTEYFTTQDSLFVPHFSTQSISILADTIYSDSILLLANSPYFVSRDIVIDSFATLSIESGVSLLLSPQVNIIVHGALLAEGESEQEITFQINEDIPCSDNNKWGAISFKNATGTSRLVHCNLLGSSYGSNRYKEKASIHSFYSNIELEQVKIPDAIQPFYSEYGNISIIGCKFYTDLTGDFINIKYADNALVENCIFEGNSAEDTDAIDFDGIHNGVIRNNRIENFFGFNSDGIDLGETCSDVLIEGNFISNCSDKGISVGQSSSCMVSQNIILACGQGLGIKDNGSIANLDHNTLFGNTLGIAVFEKNAGAGGGQVSIKNSIVSKSEQAAIFVDNLSTNNISYSLSDTDALPGNNNLQAEPRFVNASILNFELQADSPCIDSGDPDSPLDPDNSITDIGAEFQYQSPGVLDIVISEINYNSGSSCNIQDWIELYNKSNNTAIDVSGWFLKSGADEFELPENSIIPPNQYLILCRDIDNFQSHFPGISAIGNFSFGLGAGGADVKLLNQEKVITNFVIYDNQFPWPQGADGYCNSLELYDTETDNTIPFNWHTSFSNKGTPGTSNSQQEKVSNIFINEIMADNENTISDEAGEFDDWVELYNGGDTTVNIGGLFLSDKINNPMRWRIPRTNTEETSLEPGAFKVLWLDKDPEQGVLHCDFRMAASGEELGLHFISPNDSTLLDSISFGIQSPAITYGQFGDGMGNWQFLEPSPMATNEWLAAIIDIENPKAEIKIYPNPSDKILNIRLEDLPSKSTSEKCKISIFDLMGRLVHQTFKTNEKHFTIDISKLEQGNYFMSINSPSYRVMRAFIKI